MVFCCIGPDPDPSLPSGCPLCKLEEYITHKIGLTPSEIEADSPERFAIVEAEALRDLIVTTEVSGTDLAVVLSPTTLRNPECARLVQYHCKLCQ